MKTGVKYLVALAGLIAGIILARWLFPAEKTIREPLIVEKIKRDTICRVVPSDPVIIEKIRPKIIEKRDTLLMVSPFSARIDTVVKYDTIRAEYEFPENLFSMELRRRPDTVNIYRDTISRTKTKERPWWESAAYIAGGALLGFLMGSSAK